MTPRPKSQNPKSAFVSLRVPEGQMAALQHIQERFGVPISEQVRRGIALWLESEVVVLKPERKRAVTRKRS